VIAALVALVIGQVAAVVAVLLMARQNDRLVEQNIRLSVLASGRSPGEQRAALHALRQPAPPVEREADPDVQAALAAATRTPLGM
jgi:hypothetical protein